MADYPVEQLSVQMRERIVLPLTTIQQYAITRVRELEEKLVQQSPEKTSYEKLVMRCSFGIINAGGILLNIISRKENKCRKGYLKFSSILIIHPILRILLK